MLGAVVLGAITGLVVEVVVDVCFDDVLCGLVELQAARTRQAITIAITTRWALMSCSRTRSGSRCHGQFSAKSPKTFGPAALQGSTSASGKSILPIIETKTGARVGPAQRGPARSIIPRSKRPGRQGPLRDFASLRFELNFDRFAVVGSGAGPGAARLLRYPSTNDGRRGRAPKRSERSDV